MTVGIENLDIARTGIKVKTLSKSRAVVIEFCICNEKIWHPDWQEGAMYFKLVF